MSILFQFKNITFALFTKRPPKKLYTVVLQTTYLVLLFYVKNNVNILQ